MVLDEEFESPTTSMSWRHSTAELIEHNSNKLLHFYVG